MSRFLATAGLAVLLLAGWTSLPRATVSDAERALREAADAWAAAIAARDVDDIARFFAEDAFVMYPQPAPTLGREANREAWARFFARPNAEHPVTTDTVVVSATGDLGYTRGRYAGSYDGAEGRVRSGGRYVAVWQKTGGEWRIVALSANRHDPPPTMIRKSGRSSAGEHG